MNASDARTDPARDDPSPATTATTATTATETQHAHADSADARWCAEHTAAVAAHVAALGLAAGRIGEHPAWHVVPYAGIWAVENRHRPEWIGWWVICGDLPTDALPANGIDTPRDAMRAFARRWIQHAASLDRGETPAAWAHVDAAALPKLAARLRARGEALAVWADDAASWPAHEASGSADDEGDTPAG